MHLSQMEIIRLKFLKVLKSITFAIKIEWFGEFFFSGFEIYTESYACI